MRTIKRGSYTYCERLMKLRNDKGWSLQDAANELKVSKSKLNSYETKPVFDTKGKRTDKTHRRAPIEFLLVACDVYEVTLDYLCGRSDVPVPTLEDEAVVKKYGLSKEALEVLIDFNSADNFHKRVTIEFLNILIEFSRYNVQVPVVANQCTLFIKESYNDILEQEELRQKVERGHIPFTLDFLLHIEKVEFKMSKLTNQFQQLIIFLTRNDKIRERVINLYKTIGSTDPEIRASVEQIHKESLERLNSTSSPNTPAATE